MADDLFESLLQSRKLPSPPGVALRILELTRDEDTTLEDITKVISGDPALTGRILKYINSPVAGTGHPVSNLEEAVNQMGLRCVQMVALSFSLVQTDARRTARSFNYKQFWSHSLACAVANKLFAPHVDNHDPEEAFVVGLLCHLGKLALACALPGQYEPLLAKAARERSSLIQLEQEVFGDGHLYLSLRLLQEWKLPEELWTVIEQYQLNEDDFTADEVRPEDALHASHLAADYVSDVSQHDLERTEALIEEISEIIQIDKQTGERIYSEFIKSWREYGKLFSLETTDVKSLSQLQEEAEEQRVRLSMAADREIRSANEQSEELRRQANKDALTQLPNRGAFDAYLESVLNSRERATVGLIMVDADYFKKINDTHGHQAGDHVLKEIAETLREQVRKHDLVARYGGEEFAIVAKDCDMHSAVNLMERVRAAIEERHIAWKGKRLAITASLGGSLLPEEKAEQTAEKLIEYADQQLYVAKLSGRNCCRLRHNR